MASHMEQLPHEMFFIIFSYLEAHDLVNAFKNLNSHFCSLLNSSQLRVCVKINEVDVHDQISNNSIWSILRMENVNCLTPQMSHPQALVQFLRRNAPRLIHLTTLKLNIKSDDVEHIALLLSHLVNLKRLSIKEISGNENKKNQPTLISAILRMSSLKVCEWKLFYSEPLSMNTIEQQNQPVNNSIEQLCIREDVTMSFIMFLLCHLPHMHVLRLQYLSWPEYTTPFQEFLQKSLAVISIGIANTSFSNLERLIHTVPQLRCLHINDWRMRAEEDKAALFDGRLKRVLDGIACVHIGTVLQPSNNEIDEVRTRIASCSWLALREESYDYMDACTYFDIVFKRLNLAVCRCQHSTNELDVDFSLRKLGFQVDYVI